MKRLIFGMILFVTLLLEMGYSENVKFYASGDEEWHLEIVDADVLDIFSNEIREIC